MPRDDGVPRIVSAPARLLDRLLGRGGDTDAAAIDDPRPLIEQGSDDASGDDGHDQMLQGILQFRNTLAREVMTPRPDIVALSVDASRDETLAMVAEEGHSRLPVYDGTIDQVVGVLLIKDLLGWLVRDDGTAPFDLRMLIREAHFVPDTKRIGELLAELRTRKVHMAIVLDEFGGTEGLVTLEDLLEEIVGDIYDEHDELEADFTVLPSGDVSIDGGASISEVNDRLGLDLPESDYDTIGGYVFGELGRVPLAGDAVALNGVGELRVAEVEERRIIRLLLVPSAAGPPGGTEAAAGA
jgi:putative hemolysin